MTAALKARFGIDLIGVAMLATAMSGTAAAQTQSVSEAIALLPPGRLVRVTTLDGTSLQGTVAVVSTEVLTIAGRQETMTSQWSDVAAVELLDRDSLMNGVQIGAIIGAAGLGATAALVNYAACGGGGCGDASGAVMGSAAVGLGLGAVMGALIDAAHVSRELAYSAPTLVLLAPVASPGSVGLAAVISW